VTAVLVCGSRTFADRDTLNGILDALDMGSEFLWLIHGDATGADKLAAFWAERHGFPEEAIVAYPADWEVHEDTPGAAIRIRKNGDRYNAWAGGQRNQRMLDEGKPDLVVAFIDKPLARSYGTCDMVSRARKAGVKTIVVEVQ
jgi:hypothetical protein